MTDKNEEFGGYAKIGFSVRMLYFEHRASKK